MNCLCGLVYINNIKIHIYINTSMLIVNYLSDSDDDEYCIRKYLIKYTIVNELRK